MLHEIWCYGFRYGKQKVCIVFHFKSKRRETVQVREGRKYFNSVGIHRSFQNRKDEYVACRAAWKVAFVGNYCPGMVTPSVRNTGRGNCHLQIRELNERIFLFHQNLKWLLFKSYWMLCHLEILWNHKLLYFFIGDSMKNDCRK